MLRELEVPSGGDLIVGQDVLKKAGLRGRVHLIIQSGEIRVVPKTEFEPDAETFPKDQHLIQIDREQQAYETQHSQLMEKYAGQYIAMRHGKVVEHDPDRVALSKRVRDKYGNQPILITLVQPELRQTIIVRSPHLVETVA